MRTHELLASIVEYNGEIYSFWSISDTDNSDTNVHRMEQENRHLSGGSSIRVHINLVTFMGGCVIFIL